MSTWLWDRPFLGRCRAACGAGGREGDCPLASVTAARPEEVLKARLRGTYHESVRP